MTSRVILFDVIETLFSLAPLKDRFLRNGAPEESMGKPTSVADSLPEAVKAVL